MTTTEQVKQRIQEYENELRTWEDRLQNALAPVAEEVALCERMIKHVKRSLKIYEKSFPNIVDVTINGNQTGTTTVASSTEGRIY